MTTFLSPHEKNLPKMTTTNFYTANKQEAMSKKQTSPRLYYLFCYFISLFTKKKYLQFLYIYI